MQRSPTLSWFLVWGAAVLAVYAPLFWVPAAYDDVALIFRNPLVTGPWPGWKALLLSPLTKGEYEPLSLLGHWLLFHLFGPNLFVYRATSALLHAANSLLLYRLGRKLLKDEPRAFAAAVLFSLFPAHAEVLAFSTFKKHLGAAFFSLILLNWPRQVWAFALALLCKESALILPLSAMLLEGRAQWGLFLMAGTYAAGRLFVVPRTPASLVGGTWARHLLASGRILLWDAGHLLWPSGLSLEHSLGAAPGAVPGLLALAAAVAVVGRRDPLAGRALLWCLLCLVPFLNLFPYLNYSLVADRYLYLASAGFFLCAARLAGSWDPRWLLLPAALYAARACAHTAEFSDPWTLWSKAVQEAPGNPRAHVALGFEEMRRMLYPEAAVEFEKVLAIDRGLLPVFYLELGTAYAETGRLAEAIAVTKGVAERVPNPDALANLATFELRAGDARSALRDFDAASRLAPGDPALKLGRGRCLAALGRKNEAISELAGLSREPGALAALGELKRDRALLAKAAALDAMDWEAVSGLARLGDPSALKIFEARLEETLAALKERGGPEDRGRRAYVEERLRRARLLDGGPH